MSYKLPPDKDIRLKLVDLQFGGITAEQFIKWLKEYNERVATRTTENNSQSV